MQTDHVVVGHPPLLHKSTFNLPLQTTRVASSSALGTQAPVCSPSTRILRTAASTSSASVESQGSTDALSAPSLTSGPELVWTASVLTPRTFLSAPAIMETLTLETSTGLVLTLVPLALQRTGSGHDLGRKTLSMKMGIKMIFLQLDKERAAKPERDPPRPVPEPRHSQGACWPGEEPPSPRLPPADR